MKKWVIIGIIVIVIFLAMGILKWQGKYKTSTKEFIIGLDEEAKIIYETENTHKEFLISLKNIDILNKGVEVDLREYEGFCNFPEAKRLGGRPTNTLFVGEEAFCYTTEECNIKFKLVNLENNKVTFETSEGCAPPGPKGPFLPKEIIIKEKTEEVVITTDKTEYDQGENVKITVENKKASPIYYYSNENIPTIEKFENESWKAISITCLNICGCANYTGTDKIMCIALSPPLYFYSEFQSPLVYVWNQTSCVYENKHCGNDTYEEGTLKPITQGNFKAKFCYWNKEDVNLTTRRDADSNKKKCVKKEFTIEENCVIKNPDPDGYLLKICKYLKAHEDTIFPNKEPDNYSIKEIEEGNYTRYENGRYIETEVIVIRLDCCHTGDLAYIDKETNEVISFSPGDL